VIATASTANRETLQQLGADQALYFLPLPRTHGLF
jgi:hypothetical protein